MGTVLYVLAEAIRNISILLWPFMPDSMDRLLDQLAVEKGEEHRNFECLGGKGALAPGTPLPKPQGVFPRYVEEEGA